MISRRLHEPVAFQFGFHHIVKKRSVFLSSCLHRNRRCLNTTVTRPPSQFTFRIQGCYKEKDEIDNFRKNLERYLGSGHKSSDQRSLDGYKLRELLLQRYGVSFDIRLKVTPWFSGQYLLTANIMWLYQEQQSFPLTEHEYLCHLEAIAQYLQRWGVVDEFVEFVKTTKQKPRVAKAVSVPLDVPQEVILEFIRSNNQEKK
eukprot:jgi/Galph1/408/GphlegSOOS_G5144.1